MRTILLTRVKPPISALYFMLHLPMANRETTYYFDWFCVQCLCNICLSFVVLVPQFETSCSYVKATLEEFLAWSSGQPSCLSGPFSCFEHSKYWAYADYKYIARIFEDKEEVFQVKHSYYLLLP